ncbi:MAG: DUF374 domain-containing protein, partial [Gemmatimonadales bacterium]|nr:DUF374 domain-containing protein [Gemmatimonadales bacterium]
MKVRLPPAVVRVIGPALVRLLASTWRFPQPMPPPLERARSGAGALVVVLWHEELLPLLWRFRGCGFGAVVSEARDGQYVADAARRFGYLPIRGSSRRGAGKALLGAIRALQE